jgi:UDP-N-acetylmuramoyl-L-alanyl-D-glutamate--2,6-diaminopimelate ligase
MRVDEVLVELDGVTLHGDPATDVGGVVHDSRAVTAGTLFCCVRGATTDGHDHAPEAVRAGAVALLCERPLGLGVVEAVVADSRRSMGVAAAAFHGHPSRALQVVGVTGTNGKTTVTHLLAAVLRAAGRPTEVIGTLSGARTTPESTELQAQLAECRDAGTAAVAMEVSSHALALDRVEGTEFAVAVFTNLSRDHLDFHASMDDYFAAKAKLFLPGRSAVAVVNVDDPRGRFLLDHAQVPTRPYSLADVTDLEVGFERSTATWRGRRLVVPLGGAFNVSNALAAAEAAIDLGVEPDTVVAGLAAAPPVPGRFEVVRWPGAPDVVVDYAHTPDGLEQVLRAARHLGPRRLVVVFGCGGDRDREKRPAMGAAASRLADEVVVTSDNPRHEDPLAIIAAVVGGAEGPAPVAVEPDRRAAIARALAGAGPADIVVVAGKGHETTQTTGDEAVPFDDRVVVREELARLGRTPGATT